MEDVHRADAHHWMVCRRLMLGATLSVLLSTGAWANVASPSTAAPPHETIWAAPVDKTFNLHQMTPNLYRSALPNPASLVLLQQLGIRTVVSFIKEEDAKWAGSAMTLVRLPLHADRVDDTDVLRALRALQEAQAQGPVLMHCKHGRNRTGLMAAMYRIVVQGWSKEAALQEMHQGGFGDRHHLEEATRYVTRADVTRLREAYANGDCSTRAWAACRVQDWWATW